MMAARACRLAAMHCVFAQQEDDSSYMAAAGRFKRQQNDLNGTRLAL
jgi:hypothetical protein